MKYVYFFGKGHAQGSADMKELLGGKGAGLAEMTNAHLPVPPGFTITTRACVAYLQHGRQFPPGLWDETLAALHRLERTTGKGLGDARNPLLVSVRSGAQFSMPGMMDTVLNLGLNEETRDGLAEQTVNPRFAYDAYRRFIQMYAKIVMGVPAEVFDEIFTRAKKRARVKLDTDLHAGVLARVCDQFKQAVERHARQVFPTDPLEQLRLAVEAVFDSWNGERAAVYRRAHKIPDDLGTAVNVVAMVFGNLGSDCGTGVAFTRDPATGERKLYGDYLQNAQGEDVVSGVRTPQHISELASAMPEVYDQLERVAEMLERHYKDMQDLEFTVERGKLWMLQTRNGKRTGQAAVKIAVDMAHEGLIDRATALLRVEPHQLEQLLHPRLDTEAVLDVLATGINASPGAAVGRVVFDPTDAERLHGAGEKVILVRLETSPEDIRGMMVAEGILTARGGPTSHAAVVARGHGTPCVVGCEALHIDYARRLMEVDGRVVKRGDWITLDGTTGRVIAGNAKLAPAEISEDFEEIMRWADGFRRLRVRANADTPADARAARLYGAEGVGLCRTEHMFFEADRIDAVRQMIMACGEYKLWQWRIESVEHARDHARGLTVRSRLAAELAEAKRAIRKPRATYFGALRKLLPMQRRDFAEIFREMAGLPVTIRTLDPPLHEFLPQDEVGIARLARRIKMPVKDVRTRIDTLHEANPMLGLRGCRLGVIYPEITEMQTRAIFEAAVAVQRGGIAVHPEIMIPLVAMARELELQAAVVRRVAGEVMAKAGVTIEYKVGTMIELPRAALCADAIAKVAEFFSFGTNDLTQTAMGISRDDSGKFLPYYVSNRVLQEDPFQVIDATGVGQLVEIATQRGRQARPQISIGICGEHGGDPESIYFFHRVGLDYVSCSPFRVPVARLAAAQAELSSRAKESMKELQRTT